MLVIIKEARYNKCDTFLEKVSTTPTDTMREKHQRINSKRVPSLSTVVRFHHDISRSMCSSRASAVAEIKGMNTATSRSINVLLRDSGPYAQRSTISGSWARRQAGEHTVVPPTSSRLPVPKE